MSNFVKVKHLDRYTKTGGNELWLSLDHIVAVDESNRFVYVEAETNNGNAFMLTEDSMPALLAALGRPHSSWSNPETTRMCKCSVCGASTTDPFEIETILDSNNTMCPVCCSLGSLHVSDKRYEEEQK